MTRRKSICVVKICTPREVHGGVMGGHGLNVLPPIDILCGVQGGSAGAANEPGILKRKSVVTLLGKNIIVARKKCMAMTGGFFKNSY